MKLRAGLLAATLACAAAPAGAHDTWFDRLPASSAELLLALGTGTQFPRYDSGIDAQYLVQQGCRAAGDAAVARPMQPLRNEDTSLVLRGPGDAATCWAQLTPFEIELQPAVIGVYLREINASAEVRAAWADIQSRGLPWKERYTKHARVEVAAPDARPVPMAMDVLIEGAAAPVRQGDTLHFRVLRDGLPLAGQAIELRGNLSPVGIWRRTDAEGRAQVPVPLAGRWILRGVDLRLSTTAPDTWDSRFVTLAFDALPRQAARQNGINLSWNARSTNQMPATTAMTSEPPTSTARR